MPRWIACGSTVLRRRAFLHAIPRPQPPTQGARADVFSRFETDPCRACTERRCVRTCHSAAARSPAYQVIRRNGAVTPFDPSKIAVALTKAFLAVEGNSAAASRRVHDMVAELTQQIVAA